MRYRESYLCKGRVTRLLRTFCAYCTDENWSYVKIRGKGKKRCLYMKFPQIYHK